MESFQISRSITKKMSNWFVECEKNEETLSKTKLSSYIKKQKIIEKSNTVRLKLSKKSGRYCLPTNSYY